MGGLTLSRTSYPIVFPTCICYVYFISNLVVQMLHDRHGAVLNFEQYGSKKKKCQYNLPVHYIIYLKAILRFINNKLLLLLLLLLLSLSLLLTNLHCSFLPSRFQHLMQHPITSLEVINYSVFMLFLTNNTGLLIHISKKSI